MYPTAIHPSIHVATQADHREFPPVERLVVLRPAIGDASDAGEPAATELLASLMSKAARVAIVEDAPAVMVELKRGAQAVVLLEQTTTPVTQELVAAAARYYPRASVWRCAADAEGPADSLVCLSSTISVSAASQPVDREHDRSVAPAPPLPTAHAETLISEEELAMLMGPLPGKESAQR